MPRREKRTNVGPLERGLSVSLGALVTTAALRRRRAAPALLLGAAGALLLYRGVTGRSALYRALGVSGSEVGETVNACSQVTVQLPAADIHRRLRDLTEFPAFSRYLASARASGDEHWSLRLTTPFDHDHRLEVRRSADVPGERLAWTTVEGSAFPAALELRFREVGAGTEIHADAWLVPPAHPLVTRALHRAEGSRLLRRAGLGPSQVLEQELRRLRQLLEAGETATVEGQSAGGRRARKARHTSPVASGVGVGAGR